MSRQLILVDAGNTNTVFGVVRGGELVEDFRLSTERGRTADEIAALLLPLFDRFGFDPKQTEGFAVSSVVPPLQPTLTYLARRYFEVEPWFVDPRAQNSMQIRYENVSEVGADRIVNAVAAKERYGAPVIVVDFGTATTFDIVDAAGDYIGGIIAPGITISAEALFSHASRLYRVDVLRPPQLIGRQTSEAMQSGIYYGYVGLVDGILQRLLEEMPDVEMVVATGGQAEMIAGASQHIQEVAPMLTLEGLQWMYERR